MTRRLSGIEAIDNYSGVVIASDETGYGSWAGPLVVCAVAAPPGWDDPRVKDSKKMSGKVQAIFDELFQDPRFCVAVVSLDSETVDRMKVYPALLEAHSRAHREVAEKLGKPHISVIDGSLPINRMDLGPNEGAFSLPKADQKVPECSLASIFAKTIHDKYMRELHTKYPQYGFNTNVGYGGDQKSHHRIALTLHGPCPEHRRSYQPVAEALADREANQKTLGNVMDFFEKLNTEGLAK